MRKILSTSVLIVGAVLALAACHPDERCGGEFVFYGGTCRPCPAKSTFQNGTCVCDEADYYEYRNNRCALISDAMLPPVPDAGGDDDAGALADASTAGGTCAQYCDFANTCIGGNSLASFLGGVVTGLHADDVTACTSACESDVGGDGSSDPAVACMVGGVEASMCKDLDGMEGLGASLGLVGECCGTMSSNPLCTSICATLKADDLVGGMIDFCP